MIKVGIIGCGKIADQHADLIRRITSSEIVGVCDTEELMAKQLGERFGVKNYFCDIAKLLKVTQPDVVHITTPPQSHFLLARTCLNAGCNVYVEKPFTINTAEAKTLINLAEESNLKITVGHNAQFTHAMIRMRDLVNNGYLGGKPVHMESMYCYDFGDERYARALLSDKEHWVRRLPGSLLQNIISHGISKIAEFLSGEHPIVTALGFTSSFLKDVEQNDIIDEVRVTIRDEDSTTAYFTFSSQFKPVPHQFRLYGVKNSLIVDDDNQTLIKIKGDKYKSYLNHFIPPFVYAKQYMGNSIYNIKKFIVHDFHMNYGMKYLIEAFYRSVSDNTQVPISYKEIIITSQIMDSIFEQIG
jgi:predicted dehydrogenase